LIVRPRYPYDPIHEKVADSRLGSNVGAVGVTFNNVRYGGLELKRCMSIDWPLHGNAMVSKTLSATKAKHFQDTFSVAMRVIPFCIAG
jgi:hypothetical protein